MHGVHDMRMKRSSLWRHVIRWINIPFNAPSLRRMWLAVRIPASIVLFGVFLRFAKSDWFWTALAASLVGEFVQLWCFAALDKKKELAFNGPYRHVRNPMYLGRFLIVLGYVLLLRSWCLIVLTTLVYGFYLVNRVKREEKVLARIFGVDYLNYCKRINRFLPSVHGMKNGILWYWNSRLFRQNHGTSNLLATLVSYGAIYAWLAIRGA